MAVSPSFKMWMSGYAEQLQKYEDVYKWRVSVNSTLMLWPNSYLVIGIWPNGTVRQWRFVARPVLFVERAEPPGNITGILAEVCKYSREVCPSGTAFMRVPVLWADEPVPNYNHIPGDKGNGTAVAYIKLLVTTQYGYYWDGVHYNALDIVLYPNNTAYYVYRGANPKSYIMHALYLIAEEKYGKPFFWGTYPARDYLPKGVDEWSKWQFELIERNGTKLSAVRIISPTLYYNGTAVLRTYYITNDTGCLGITVKKYGNYDDIDRYTHKVTNCSIDQFLVEEIRFDVTPLRIPYICPNCTGPLGFKIYELRQPRGMLDWLYAAPAPTVLTPLLSYRSDEVALVKFYKLENGRLREVKYYENPHYVAVTFAKASEEYYALRAAAQIVDLLIP